MKAIQAVVLATFLAIVVLGSIAIAILSFNASVRAQRDKESQAASYETRLQWANEQSRKFESQSAALSQKLTQANDKLMEANRLNVSLRSPVTTGDIANQLDSLHTEIASLQSSNQVLRTHIKTLENYIQSHDPAQTTRPQIPIPRFKQ